LLRSHPGGVQEELAVKDLPRRKYRIFLDVQIGECANVQMTGYAAVQMVDMQ